MRWIIDGHNLIPKIPSVHLSDINDEDHLIEALQEYARLSRKTIEVYFDRGKMVGSPMKKAGTVRAYFVPEGSTADDAIIAKVQKSKRMASEITVVSSDHHVQNQVKALGANTMKSEDFSRMMQQTFSSPETKTLCSRQSQKSERALSSDEVAQWMEIFNSGPLEKYSE